MAPLGFLPQIGPLELAIVLAIVVLILGPKRIPAAAKSLGEGFRNFRGSMGGGDDDKAEKPELGEKKKTEE